MPHQDGNAIDYLKARILLLEKRKADEWAHLESGLNAWVESECPDNERNKDLSVREEVIRLTTGILTGYLSRKFLTGSTHHPLKKLIGIFLQEQITLRVYNDREITHLVTGMLSKLFAKLTETSPGHDSRQD